MTHNYKLRTVFGWIVLLIISLIPVLLWLVFGPGISELTDYSSTTHALGEIFGLVGMTMFALTFVLSTRIKYIEDVFGGLDKAYIVHALLGGTALILILAHPIFLVLKFIPSEISTAAKYLLPSSNISVNLGIIALTIMVILIYITLYTKIKYHTWKFTHEFLGLVFLFALLHIFLVRGSATADNIFDGYYIYASVVSFIGLFSFSYSLFLKNRIIKNAVYKINDIKTSKDLFVLELTPEHKPLSYKSGQFVFVRFYNNKLSKEAHPFSIASKSDSESMRIIVKKLGDFTNNLEYLKVGDKVSLEGPYGRFHFKNYASKDQIWIASGIGITPFIGMAEDLEEKKVNVDLYYTTKDKSDMVGYDLFNQIALNNKHFRFIDWSSNEKGRITLENIKKISGTLKNKEFLICGSPQFKESIINELRKEKIKNKNIHEEAFDFR